MLWCIHKVKEFESDSQHNAQVENLIKGCDVSTKLKNLKATHNLTGVILPIDGAVMYPQS